MNRSAPILDYGSEQLVKGEKTRRVAHSVLAPVGSENSVECHPARVHEVHHHYTGRAA